MSMHAFGLGDEKAAFNSTIVHQVKWIEKNRLSLYRHTK